MEGVLSPVFQLMVAPAGMPPAVLAVSVVELPAQIGEVPEMETGAKYSKLMLVPVGMALLHLSRTVLPSVPV
jgi:hypothetical protein